MSLEARLRVTQGPFDLEVDLGADEDAVVAVLGPNGAGKTTTLRCLAGLRELDGGHITLDGAVLDDPATRTLVPPERRPVGVVFQDHLLFPRLTALENVAFGLRARGIDRRRARAQAAGWLERMGLDHLAESLPRELSGGQSQRVALARALATEPRLLLLDEPTASLDVQARASVRAELRRALAGAPGIRLLVTHDPVDALVLADRLVVLEQGRVVQAGATREVVARPRTRYVADLVGLNLLVAVRLDAYTAGLPEGGVLRLADPLPAAEVAIAVRPQAVALHAREPSGSPRNHWPAVVTAVEGAGDRLRISLGGPVPVTAEVTPAAAGELGLEPGAAVWASVKAVDLVAYER